MHRILASAIPALACLAFALPVAADDPAKITLKARKQVEVKEAGTTTNVAVTKTVPTFLEVAIEPKKTAVVVCDMWDDHYCKSAAQRVGGRDLLAFPLGLVAEPAPLSMQMAGGLWNPATSALAASVRLVRTTSERYAAQNSRRARLRKPASMCLAVMVLPAVADPPRQPRRAGRGILPRGQ